MRNDMIDTKVTSKSPLDEISTELSERRTGMSFQRTRLSVDRTLMSVIRTSVSLITFGFTIFQFFQTLKDQSILAGQLRPVLLDSRWYCLASRCS